MEMIMMVMIMVMEIVRVRIEIVMDIRGKKKKKDMCPALVTLAYFIKKGRATSDVANRAWLRFLQPQRFHEAMRHRPSHR